MWEFQSKVWEISLYVGNQLVDDSAFSVHSIISAKICIKWILESNFYMDTLFSKNLFHSKKLA